jgi:hypothetical protein
MSKTTVDIIIDTLEADMKKFIKVSKNYRTTPSVVYRGAFSPSETSAFPVIGFDILREDFDVQYLGGDGTAFIEIDIYGYCYSDGVDRISDIRDLAHDALKFINSDFSLTDTTEIIGKLEYGGHKTLMFRLPIRVSYEWNESNIG